MMALTDSNILYFPHIEISDPAFLKSALCIWDTVLRIVPQGYVPQDSDEIREATDAGALQNIQLSSADLIQTREDYHDFLESILYMPDALDRSLDATVNIHRDKLDSRMVAELSDLLGIIVQHGDWLQLPRGLADGYMLYLSNAVARRRHLPKFTDSDTLFACMQYFETDGNIGENIYPEPEDDFSAALVLKHFVPGGISDASMKDVLRFRRVNGEGRQEFRTVLTELARQLSLVEDEEFAVELAKKFGKQLQESQKTTVAHIREFFSQPESLLLYLGLPLAAKAYELAADVKHDVLSLGAFAIAGIAALADVAKSKRKDWSPAEATYYCKLKQEFDETSPLPKRMRALGALMDEFMND